MGGCSSRGFRSPLDLPPFLVLAPPLSSVSSAAAGAAAAAGGSVVGSSADMMVSGGGWVKLAKMTRPRGRSFRATQRGWDPARCGWWWVGAWLVQFSPPTDFSGQGVISRMTARLCVEHSRLITSTYVVVASSSLVHDRRPCCCQVYHRVRKKEYCPTARPPIQSRRRH
jgi:hypothetical protein